MGWQWSQQGLVGQGSRGQWEKRKEQLLWAKNHQENVKNNENQKKKIFKNQTRRKFNNLNSEAAYGFGDYNHNCRQPHTFKHSAHGSNASPATCSGQRTQRSQTRSPGLHQVTHLAAQSSKTWGSNREPGHVSGQTGGLSVGQLHNRSPSPSYRSVQKQETVAKADSTEQR